MAELCEPLPGYLDVAVRFSVVWTCAAVLLLKKLYHESPERRWSDFLFDCSKQIIGAGWGYLLGKSEERCGPYLAGTVAETTAGMLINYVLLTIFTRLFERGSENPRAFRTGEYENSKGALVPGFFIMQSVLWLTCITCMKSIVPAMIAPFEDLAGVVVEVLSLSPHVELIFVALWAPCGLYAFQVWITDDFLKKVGAPGVVWRNVQAVLPRPISNFLDEHLVTYKEPPKAAAPPAYVVPYQPPMADASVQPSELGVGTPGASALGDVEDVRLPQAFVQQPPPMLVHPSLVGTPSGAPPDTSPGGSPGALTLSPGGASQMSATSVKDIIETAAQAAAASAERIFLGQVKGIKAVLSQRERDLKKLESTLKKISTDDELLQHQLSGQIKGIGEDATPHSRDPDASGSHGGRPMQGPWSGAGGP